MTEILVIDWGNYTRVMKIANVYRHSAGIAMTMKVSL